ncbi:MAG: hypothetical protein APF76_03680 [Desulfitibacter sp. BRH_c19]|nr:MAG: hypothetical protein APF76_03680 [Desulfitibacter sp. BRH_c19]
MDKDKKAPLDKEEKKMSAIPKKVQIDRQSILDRISSKTTKLNAKKGKVKLNPDNPSHKDWYEDK